MSGPARWRQAPLAVVGLAIIGVLAAVAVLAPVLAPHDPKALSGPSLQRPSADHLLGTNDVGQDIFSQLVYGSRAALVVATSAAALAVLLGVLIGVIPALVGGTTDAAVNRAVVLAMALPGLPLIIVVASLAGADRPTVIVIIALIGWPPLARVLRSQTLTLRQRGFVATARGFGGGSLYLVRRHLAPALAPLMVVGFVNWAGVAIGLEAALAFLGLGDPHGVSWGLTLNRALDYRGIYFSGLWTWWVLPAGLAVTVAVLGFTFVGVGLEPWFNPRWQRTS